MTEIPLVRMIRIEGGHPNNINDADRYDDVMRTLAEWGFTMNYSSPDNFFQSYSSDRFTRPERTVIILFRGNGNIAHLTKVDIVGGL
jgi:hypothetical protein